MLLKKKAADEKSRNEIGKLKKTIETHSDVVSSYENDLEHANRKLKEYEKHEEHVNRLKIKGP